MRPSRHVRAFTLLELIIALAIVAMLITGGFALSGNLNREQRINKPIGEIRTMAKKAWMRAMAEQNAWQIRISSKQLVLEPRQPLLNVDAEMVEKVNKFLGRKHGVEVYSFDDNIRIEVQKWGDQKPRPPAPDSPDVWIFEGSGLCEPILLRLVFDEQSAVSLRFDPLTAAVQEQTYE